MNSEKEPIEPEEIEELVDADDEVIGRATRLSALVLLGIVAVVAAIWLIRGSLRDEAPTAEIAAEAPRAVAVNADPPQVEFVDVTTEIGIDFVHTSGAVGEALLPETMGSGAAFLDFDDDGDQDLFLTNGQSWDGGREVGAFYVNEGGQFADQTSAVGLDLSFYATGVAVGDFDNDGFVDLFIASLGTNRLLRNVAGGDAGRRFEDVTRRAGVLGSESEWSTSAAFLDVDNDGDLDLFVGNYVEWSRQIDLEVDYQLTGIGRAYGPPDNYGGTFPYLYRNEGDGRFTDVSEEAGIRVRNSATGGPVAKTLGLAPGDFDLDGDLDLVVANDTVRNFFFLNRGDGTFEENGELFGVAYGRDGLATGAMGIDMADFRNDGETGFAIGNFANEMTSLYVSQGDPTLYSDEAIAVGLGASSRRVLSFGVFFFDYDLDGRLDLLQANGHLEDEINVVEPSQFYRQPAQLFWNRGGDSGATFVAIPTPELGALSTELVGRAATYADIDSDGDLDVLVAQTGDRPLLVENRQDTGHHWLRIRVRGDGQAVNRDGIGTWVRVEAAGEVQRRLVMPTRSYQSQSELPVTFGLGTVSAVDRLEVTWPDGLTQEVAVSAVDRTIEVVRE